MTIKIHDAGGTLRTIARMRVQDGASLRTVQTIKIMDTGATLRTVAQFVSPMTVAAAPTYLENFGGGDTVTSDLYTATPTGGLAPFTYVWSRVTGTGGITAPTTASTRFTASGLSIGQDASSTFRCTVTDSSGQVVITNTVEAYFQRTGFLTDPF